MTTPPTGGTTSVSSGNSKKDATERVPPSENGTIHFTIAVAEESIQQKAIVYDRAGDAHYDTISAFIKSMRASDEKARCIGSLKCCTPAKIFVSSRGVLSFSRAKTSGSLIRKRCHSLLQRNRPWN